MFCSLDVMEKGSLKTAGLHAAVPLFNNVYAAACL